MTNEKYKVNPGGNLPADKVIGRDDDIEFLWEKLEALSILLTAERRIGKTSIIQKMQEDGREGWVIIYLDTSGYSSPVEFITGVYNLLFDHFTKVSKTKNVTKDFFGRIKGAKVCGSGIELDESSKSNWKQHLENSIQETLKGLEGSRLLLLLDEFPTMLDRIRKKSSDEAKELFDVLRKLRQDTKTKTSLRMILTGSIGIHHVVNRLKEIGYPEEPLNDLYYYQVQTFSIDKANLLSKLIIDGEELGGKVEGDLQEFVEYISQITGGFPYFIHLIFDKLKQSDKEINTQSIKDCVLRQLTETNDPWELRHFRTRLRDYYPDHTEIAENILTVLAFTDELSIADLESALVSQFENSPDKKQLKKLLTLLSQDHYLIRNERNKWQWNYEVIKKWWKLDEDCTPEEAGF